MKFKVELKFKPFNSKKPPKPKKDSCSYFVVVEKWPNEFNGPLILIGDWLGDIWRVVDPWGTYSEPYQFIDSAHVTHYARRPDNDVP